MRKSEKPQITEAELAVMRLLWREKRPLSFKEIRLALEKETDWKVPTMQTLLRRLCEKGAVTQSEHYVLIYSANVTEAEYIRKETPAFVRRVFGGSAKRLAAALCEEGELTEDDLNELRQLLRDKE